MTLINSAILLMLMLQTKHLIFDWLWQTPFEYKNKGKYGHHGGLIHALKHLIGTEICLFIMMPITSWKYIVAILLAEFVIHYHIDWAKTNINVHYKWGPTTTDNFWRLTGFDQYLHQICYIVIVWVYIVIS